MILTLTESDMIRLEMPLNCGISLDVTEPESFQLNILEAVVGSYQLEPYEGPTIVVPKAFLSTVLDTSNKAVYSDITVLEIPYTETSNPSGGTTVSIG